MNQAAGIDPRNALTTCYELRVRGIIPPEWSEWFEGFALFPLDAGETLLVGRCADQAALHGVLVKIRDLNLELLSVCPAKPDQA